MVCSTGSITFGFTAAFSLLFQTFGAFQRSTLYRDRQISYANFDKPDFEQRLSVEKVASFLVEDSVFGCPFKCVGEPRCFSFNIAVYPDSKGLFLCELLATDKYRAKSKLEMNATFHHHSPLSPCESDPCQNDGNCIPDFEVNSYHCDCKAGYNGTYCEACKFDFEDGIYGWEKTGTVFNNQPTYGDNPTARYREPANQQGDWWIGTAEDRPSKAATPGGTQDDAPQGTLTSPSFNISGNGISFLIGGGCDINLVRAELIIDQQVVKTATGKCTETMTRTSWDVGAFIGESAHFKLVDFSSGGWGHINFDDLRGNISCGPN